jgi:hypothetical protein
MTTPELLVRAVLWYSSHENQVTGYNLQFSEQFAKGIHTESTLET